MRCTRREFLRLASIGAASVIGGSVLQAGPKQKRHPNIIFVFADQMRSHVLGCYGGTQVPTPGFDRFAAEGAVFENAVSTYPVCSPYRAMLISGLYPMNNHTIFNDTAMRRDVPTIATVCKQAGYKTGYIGKWHLEDNRNPFIPSDRRLGFEDFWASDNCMHKYFDGFYCADTPEKINLPGYKPERQTTMAIDFINRYRNEPFCLFMSWGPPHDPYKGPDEYMKKYPPENISLRQNTVEHAMVDSLIETDPTAKKVAAQRSKKRKTYENDDSLRQDVLQGYLALTESLDVLMNRLLDAIKAAGLEDDTIIAFSSDHGDMLGSHRMASKQMPFEESISIPFLLKYPPQIKAGSRTDALLAPIDIMPTLLSLAGVKCPTVDGQDLSGAATGKTGPERDAVLIMKMHPGGNPWVVNGVTPWRGVRTKRYTYARLNDRGPWVLFDNQADPYQMNNLINNPEYADLQARLDQRTNELLKEANDPDDTEKIIAFRNKK